MASVIFLFVKYLKIASISLLFAEFTKNYCQYVLSEVSVICKVAISQFRLWHGKHRKTGVSHIGNLSTSLP